MDVFAREWTYRSPQVTVTYPAGWSGNLPPERQIAARKAGVLVPPILELENADGSEGPTAPRAPRRDGKAESGGWRNVLGLGR